MLNEGNQIHNFISSSSYETVFRFRLFNKLRFRFQFHWSKSYGSYGSFSGSPTLNLRQRNAFPLPVWSLWGVRREFCWSPQVRKSNFFLCGWKLLPNARNSNGVCIQPVLHVHSPWMFCTAPSTGRNTRINDTISHLLFGWRTGPESVTGKQSWAMPD